MAPQSRKRKVSPTTVPEPKRNKSPHKADSRPKARARASGKPRSKSKAAPARRAVLDPSALAWQPVGEDFGGLQVLSGVDVVRDGEAVRFLVKSDEGDEADGPPVVSGGQDDDESFEGFGEVPAASGALDAREAGNSQDGLAGEARRQEVPEVPEVAGGKAGARREARDQNDRRARRDARRRKVADKAAQTPAAHGAGNEFTALAALADEEAEDDDGDVDVGAWMALNLSPCLVSAVARLGFAKPTAIQEKSIPEIVAGADVIGKAQTGSGKTLAFALPIVEKWLEMQEGQRGEGGEDADEPPRGGSRGGPMAVILSPTRELAKQIGDHIKAVCDGLAASPYVCVVTGGLSVQKQQRQLETADVVVGTPGRLWEVLDGDAGLQEQFTRIKFLVVDEADRLLKAGQFKEAESIVGALDRESPEEEEDGCSDDGSSRAQDEAGDRRQTLVFSATFDENLQTKLAGKGKGKGKGNGPKAGSDEEKMAYLIKRLKFRREPKFVDVNPASRMADNLREGLIECGAMEKDLYLYTVLLLNPGRRTLVFTNSISAVRRITPLLQHLNQNALPLHSQMMQKARLRSLEKFAAERSTILVATDVAARGLDIKDVDQVVHYHVPRAADTYIHRSGRTARADRSGVSIILCSPDEVLPTRRLAGKVHAERCSSGQKQHVIESLPIDRKIASRLKPRLDLAKKITDAILAKEKSHSNEVWLRNAAEELGVEYDSEEFEATASSGWGGGSRGGGRRRKEKEAKALTKAEMGALKAQLRQELSQRVNLGVSERYITGGRVDVAQLLKERESSVRGIFLGGDNLGLDMGL
ncbi:DEAD-like helicase [Metarhizium album ARSEF 1941]|uniref:RNA helicase n=1 Tax=Metarhizium album (strain ARSEF 1941) TaxID=1081103 RepID=A0A0B2WSI1_METAS|nr:DEAD-like helicase [Metarhizium album ARSEF 1941]KHN95910.1 DEAD-like helicase [Metarhizium album ARSEF 1941]